jgi:hypothetical protein
MPKKEYIFEQINMKSYKIKCDSEILYRIYKDKDEFIDIPSSSLQEAVAQSNIPEPFKIKVLMPKKRKYFEEDDLEEIKK